MFWLLTKKHFKKESNKISKSFDKVDKALTELTSQSLNNRIQIDSNKESIVSRHEIDLMIRERMLELREPTSRTTRTKETNLRKKANKILDKVEIMREMASLLQKGLSTTEIQNIIVNEKSLIKKTCFFKYIKLVREQTNELREPLRRSNKG